MRRIVLTGGDASGKSTVWDYLRQKYSRILQEVPEMATALTGGLGGAKILPALGRDIDVTPEALGLFQGSMRTVQLISEQMWEIVARANGKKACLLDRGMADLVAYAPGGWADVTSAFGMTKEQIYARYDIVINLRSLAYRDPEKYQQVLTENPSRTPRTVEEAIALDEAILRAWQDHPNVIVIDADIEEVLETVERIILLETSKEIERKFYLGNRVPQIVYDKSRFSIDQEQGYLYTQPGEFRVRKETLDKRSRYTWTIKSDGSSVRMESPEHELQEWEFNSLWKHTENDRIKKTRYVMVDGDLVYEVDLYEYPDRFVVVEVEFEDLEAFNRFVLPDWMEGAIDVTDNLNMKAKNIAKHGFRVPRGA